MILKKFKLIFKRTWRYYVYYSHEERYPRIHSNPATAGYRESIGAASSLRSVRTAAKFVEKLKFFVARQKFRETLKPYDVRDVMEQHRVGTVDMLGRIRVLQTDLEDLRSQNDEIKTVKDRMERVENKLDRILLALEKRTE